MYHELKSSNNFQYSLKKTYYYFIVTVQNHPYSKMKSGLPEIAFLIAS